ncbi:MAG TPA: hypothetical protein DIT94_08995 [Deltaproteobacteria bacterium]|nr:hypothetical protein [Deltaproteobacteria bacterium]
MLYIALISLITFKRSETMGDEGKGVFSRNSQQQMQQQRFLDEMIQDEPNCSDFSIRTKLALFNTWFLSG